MKYSTLMRQGSIGRRAVLNRGDMLKRGSGVSAFTLRESFATARPGSVRWIEAGSDITLAHVLKAMLRKSDATGFGFSIVLLECLQALRGFFIVRLVALEQSLAGRCPKLELRAS